MDNNLAVVYLSVFVGLLAFAGVSVFREIFKTRKLEGSLSKLKSKLTKEKGTAQEYYELASIYSEKKVFTQSIPLFQKALKAAEEEGEENIAPIYNGLGYVYFAQEQYDLAIRQYKEAIKLNPDYISALNNLGHAYEKKKLNSQALEMYEAVLKLVPNNATAKRRAESLRRLVTA
ncbi:tetratricopeptide repeat protein [Anabaena cylindrica FACHB-243]|uniref:Tetratricopeptide TPR_1 repeat-containing protein n=1 Tax=Anabaena cylindrica (strain ATCC 27899 / PCC 7122) TaxID=272123 RepID=K9ZPW7_ANACC|nr:MULTISPECIES: tetratricopeptide repeat protein [Anabaena]AFZ60395.1 Tetratricopeptide TPR_1 repeat-containing protein [Anabaena cylindrica PCC 7122]MBD2416383.1 tetratricopeptide repeat protein [Anabaena cylindrica FACHB-243]MBY5285094.1 tetratricopeptide repeat protein [Anabaena sp. CCAP 1446/1C]MBY5308762.1 tetratricopeptide repeat protein [Anabaena sp. CCAP 1446/1C]MCM2408436.1 tetratricopeptide repeat protein [Anabaena sp. CCAP 1446/1C]